MIHLREFSAHPDPQVVKQAYAAGFSEDAVHDMRRISLALVAGDQLLLFAVEPALLSGDAVARQSSELCKIAATLVRLLQSHTGFHLFLPWLRH
ncbi:hypothetical protein [Erythrobacter sp.]|uniref:hypothetical protein n=1 Tax=Erythrobacter sp. TaxID=1042 RepID=UPI0025EA2262|nr:hypothetical protein [Erythrobacter sp.]